MNKKQQHIAFRAGTLVVSVLCMLSLTGCFGVDGQFKQLRGIVLDGTNSSYEVEAEFGIGGFVIGMVRKVASWSDDPEADIAIDILSEVKGVQVGNYILDDYRVERSQLRTKSLELIDYLSGFGYDAIVRSYEDDNLSLVMVKSDMGAAKKIKEVVVVSLDTNELSLVQLKGDVNSIIDIACRERGMNEVEVAVEQSI